MTAPSESAASKRVVVCGLGRVGWRVLEWLRAAGVPVVAVDTAASPDDPRLVGVTFVKGDCRQQELLEQAGVRTARGVLVLTSDDTVNVPAALVVRRLNPDARIVVRMFNQNLLARLGTAVKNITALSVSALTAPMLALTASTGEALGAFRLEMGSRQVSELVVPAGSELVGRTIAEVCERYSLVPLVLTPVVGRPRFLLDLSGDARLSAGDELIVVGSPQTLRMLAELLRGDLLPGVQWAGTVRRWFRTLVRTLREVDLAVKIITPVLIVTIFASTLIHRYGLDNTWAQGLYHTVTIVATGSALHGENRPEWAQVFLSLLKLVGAAILAGFTAILTNYLIRARLGGALEVRRVPDGGHVVVCGIGNIGFRCIEELVAIGDRAVAIDKSADNPFIATCRRQGVPTFVGDATVMELLRQARADTARAVIAATSSELANLEIALLVREINPTQRVVVRLSDAEFAEAVREAANIRDAVSIPALAAPAFAAALFGDRVLALLTVEGRTLIVFEFVVQDDDPCLSGRSIRAAAVDYRFLPLAINGRDPAEDGNGLLDAGERLAAVAELPDLERLLRREAVPKNRSVTIDGFPADARDGVVTRIQAARHCSQEEAERLLGSLPITVADGLTRGEAEELRAKLAAEQIAARVV